MQPLPQTAPYKQPADALDAARLVELFVAGGLVFGMTLAAVAFSGSDPSVIFFAFLTMFGIAPLFAASVVYLKEQTSTSRKLTVEGALFVVKAFLLACIIALNAFLALIMLTLASGAALWIAALVGLVSVVAIAAVVKTRGHRRELSSRLDAIIVTALGIAVFILSPFNPTQSVPIGFLAYAFQSPSFGYWSLFGIGWLSAGIWLRRREGWAFAGRIAIFQSITIAVGLLFVLALYDDGHFADFAHYQPLIGPAMHAMHGGIPMVDTYSQYGLLPWLLLWGAFKLFAPTFGTAAVFMRLLNVSYFVVMMLTLVFASRRRISALWFFVPALLVAITSHGPGPFGMWNMNALPMVLGGRWLLPSIVTLLLVAARTKTWALWVSLFIIALASLSSFEILAFTLGPWVACLLLDAIRARAVGTLTKHLLLAFASIVVAHACFVGIVYLISGRIADYRPYFSLALFNRPSKDSEWSVPFASNYALWFPIGLAFFFVIAEAAYHALRGGFASRMCERLLPVAILGLGPLTYFFGRPQEATLNIVCLPFAVVAIGIAESVFINARRFGKVGPALVLVMAFSFAFTIADGFEHFMRPFEPTRGNASFLRRCFTPAGCWPGDAIRNISLALQTPTLDPRTDVAHNVADAAPRIAETTSMLQQFAPGVPHVGMIVDLYDISYGSAYGAIGIVAFMSTGQWYAWSQSSTLNDENSPILVKRAVQEAAATASGTPIIASNERERLLPINKAILEALEAHCHLRLLERGKYVSAFVTENCTATTKN